MNNSPAQNEASSFSSTANMSSSNGAATASRIHFWTTLTCSQSQDRERAAHAEPLTVSSSAYSQHAFGTGRSDPASNLDLFSQITNEHPYTPSEAIPTARAPESESIFSTHSSTSSFHLSLSPFPIAMTSESELRMEINRERRRLRNAAFSAERLAYLWESHIQDSGTRVPSGNLPQRSERSRYPTGDRLVLDGMTLREQQSELCRFLSCCCCCRRQPERSLLHSQRPDHERALLAANAICFDLDEDISDEAHGSLSGAEEEAFAWRLSERFSERIRMPNRLQGHEGVRFQPSRRGGRRASASAGASFNQLDRDLAEVNTALQSTSLDGDRAPQQNFGTVSMVEGASAHSVPGEENTQMDGEDVVN